MKWKNVAWALLVATASAAGAAQTHAEDYCATLPNTCVREVFSRSGTVRTLHVSFLRQDDAINHFNVILPGSSQFEVEPGHGFSITIPDDGKAVYSAQPCFGETFNSSTCNPWAQLVRPFPSRSTCNDYTNTAVASIVEAQRLGCGFGGGHWNSDPQAHLNACLDQGVGFQSFLDNEANLRAGELAACKANVAAASKPPKPVKTTGRAKKDGNGGSSAKAGVLTCRGGGGMNVEVKKDSVFVYFEPSATPSNQAAIGPGQCAWEDRVVGPKESHRIALTAEKDRADQLIKAARNGDTFVVAAVPMTQFIMVNTIVSVDGFDSGPAPAEAEPEGPVAEAEPEDEEQPPAPAPVQSADCPAGVATVSTASVGEEVLNVRAMPSASAEIVTQVPDGSEVSVVGACVSGAGFAKGKTLKPKGQGGKARPEQTTQASAGWCRIDEPAQGCVKAEFLAFEAPRKGKGAGLAKTLKPKDEGGAAAQATFAGKWTVTADDDTSYTMSMTQKGSSVSGNYKGGDGSKGTFKGKVKGNVLKFTWKQSDGYSGSGKFALSADGGSFDGSYNFGSNADEVEGRWNGSRN